MWLIGRMKEQEFKSEWLFCLYNTYTFFKNYKNVHTMHVEIPVTKRLYINM